LVIQSAPMLGVGGCSNAGMSPENREGTKDVRALKVR
jgi:hypothetical protein